MSTYIREEDKNPDLYTETYVRWEDWMVGEVVCYKLTGEMSWGVVTKKRSEESFYVVWENGDNWLYGNTYVDLVRFKKRHTNKDSKVEVLAVRTVSIPTEIKFEGRVYVLKEGV